MVFIDSLTVMLLSTGFTALIISFYIFMLIKAKKDFTQLIVPAFVFGLFDAVSGFVMSFTWPLPGSYNILFGDPLLIAGLILISGACMLYKKIDLRILSIFAVFLGIYILIGAVAMFAFHLESGNDLISASALYILSGLSSVLSPSIYMNPKGNGRFLYWILFIMLILTALVSFFISFNGLYMHLQYAP